jgi:hypothetical protein
MKITFRELYETLQSSKVMISRMETDLENAPSEEVRGLIEQELVRLRASFLDLYNVSVSTNEYMTEIRAKVDACMTYINVF